MINEVEMKRIEKRLDELHKIAAQSLEDGTHAPDEIKKEHRELADRYNEMVSILRKRESEDLLKKIEEESNKY